MFSDTDKLLKNLEVKQVADNIFTGESPAMPPRIYGGQVLAQSLYAAMRTVEEDRIAHSLHANFLRPGDPKKTVVYEVDRIRDGRSFNTRQVVAKQDGLAIFSTSVSFQVSEDGLSHQMDAPAVPAPEALENDDKYWTRINEIHKGQFAFMASSPVPVERHSVTRRDPVNPQPTDPAQQVWMKVLKNPGDDLQRHQLLLTYMSDFGLLATALYPHPHSTFGRSILPASLDHSLWFHRPFRVDEHLLFSMDSPNASGGRGFSRGSFYTRDGELVASCAQESLIRLNTHQE